MNGLNLPRVLLGGLVAGLVINAGEYVLNGVLLAEVWAAFRARLGLPAPGGGQLAASFAIILAYGVVLVWIYAAIRPRFEPGVRAALYAGLALWVLTYLLFTASLWAAGLITVEIAVVTTLWGVLEVPVAAIAGAWLYRENAPPQRPLVPSG